MNTSNTAMDNTQPAGRPPGEYGLSAIRDLVKSAFSAAELGRFCSDRDLFRPLSAELMPDMTLAKMSDLLMEYCHRRVLFGELLEAIKSVNPKQYAIYEERLAKKRAQAEAAEALASQATPLILPFTNREDDLSFILAQGAPPYCLLDAPAGYGKTELLNKLAIGFQEGPYKKWLCARVRVAEADTLPDVARALVESLGIELAAAYNRSPEQLGEDWAGVFRARKKKLVASPDSGLVLVIDLDKKSSLTLVSQLIQGFIPGVQRSLRGLRVFATASSRFRVVLAGRRLAPLDESQPAPIRFSVRQLQPFDYGIVRDTIAKCLLEDYEDDWIDQLAAHLIYYTGGHPGCIARVWTLYASRNYPPPDSFFGELGPQIRGMIISPVLEDIYGDIPARLHEMVGTLSVFRCLTYTILRHMVSGREPLIPGYKDEVELADELTNTYLYSWHGRLLKDDTTRRLLAIQACTKDSRSWVRRCKLAQDLCAQQLQQRTSRVPEYVALEYLFQCLQQHTQTVETERGRARVRKRFFGTDVPHVLQMLDSGEQQSREDRKAFAQALMAKESWDFRFIVNYYMRRKQYDDRPLTQLLESIEPEAQRH